ncbi:hypothetical protein N4G66_26230 [Streptomyces rhizosphaerihabitans]|uniref:hypothetical protein n=1 Tax=Streptomyces rhizosphaerihabitans TaxID=1266770 RepID=UPI0021C20156|nr:hypothetical protein [Streptomyces rhizosphaerihabitans]MCT9008309.1 hypothetical protein [Streptomyces rhizosphaerihabitans]
MRATGLLLISDKGSASKGFKLSLSEQGITLLRPSGKKEILRPDEPMLSIRHLFESVSDTLKGRLDREQHDGHAVESVAVRVTQRMLAPAEPVPLTPPPAVTGGAPRYLFRGPAMGPLASGPGMTVSPLSDG